MFTEDLYPDFAALCGSSRTNRVSVAPKTRRRPVRLRRGGRRAGRKASRARDKLSAGFQQALEIRGRRGSYPTPRTKSFARCTAQGGSNHRAVLWAAPAPRLSARVPAHRSKSGTCCTRSMRPQIRTGELYAAGYGLRRLRDRAVRRSAHDRQGDLWEAVEDRLPRSCGVGNHGWGSPPWPDCSAPEECPDLDAAKLENGVLLGALFQLGLASRTHRPRARKLAGHGAGRTRLRLRGPTGAGSRRSPEMRAFVLVRERGRERWTRTKDHRQLLHAGRTGTGSSRKRARPGSRPHDRRQSRASHRCAARPGYCRSRVRLWTLPARGGAATRRPRRWNPHGGHANTGGLPAGASRRSPADASTAST